MFQFFKVCLFSGFNCWNNMNAVPHSAGCSRCHISPDSSSHKLQHIPAQCNEDGWGIMHRRALYCRNVQKQAFFHWKPCLIISLEVGLTRTWNPAPIVYSIKLTVYCIKLTVYFLALSHTFNLADMRRVTSPLSSHCALGGVLMVRSDYKT